MELIEKYLVEKNGLEKVEKKTVTVFAVQNLPAFSITETPKKIIISFPMFKDETRGSRTTPKKNKQREEFLRLTKKENCVDISKPAPFAEFEDEKVAVDFLKKYKVVKLAKDYSEFSEVNSDYVISEEEVDGLKLKYRSSIPTEVEIMRDVFKKNEYVHKGLILGAKDVVLDLGGNIGAFCCRNFREVKKIVSFEPEDVNFEIMSENVKLNNAKNIIIQKKPLLAMMIKLVIFFLGKVPYYYSFFG